ncbi:MULTISPECIES: hypothetical protein [Streptomyces]|nr:hypothetical protein [Streptomyces katrae]
MSFGEPNHTYTQIVIGPMYALGFVDLVKAADRTVVVRTHKG